MNGYSFTEHVRGVLAVASKVATEHRQEYVTPEMLFVALSRGKDAGAVAVLESMGIDAGALGAEVDARIETGTSAGPSGDHLPYATRAKKVLELAMTEARELHHSFVGTEHLLLGLIREGKSGAAAALVRAGATPERAQDAVRERILLETVASRSGPQDTATQATSQPRSVTILTEYADGRLDAVRLHEMADVVIYLKKIMRGK